ncbi:MAG: orotidine 5'-phosphate decarboxylase, partial [Elusimicrobia bacterium RIFOXYB2_FULL_49_7]
MTFIDKLRKASADNRSLLCVGLDFDPEKTPPPFRDDPAAYNKLIIDATQDLVCAYKPNAAFYEGLGRKGLDALSATLSYIPSHIPVILDAKRGDIGNTSAQYARAVFEEMGADAVTVSPYMGEDSVSPFLQFAGKGVFVLCLTSNPGSKDFQRLKCGNEYIYLHVARKCVEWAARYPADLGLVVGATQEEIAEIRSLCLLPFLVPGVGSQGGDLGRAVREGNRNGALAVINASRSIIYPSGSG